MSFPNYLAIIRVSTQIGESMRKKRILFCSEATFLNTGYATYIREVMSYLHSTGRYELGELACYGQRNDPRGLSLPWHYYGVQPNKEFEPRASKEEIESYESNPFNQFGEFIFEDVCLDFKPDIVFDIRDFWMLEFVERSPFRKLFKWVIMPTVDAAPQARQWISTYSSADAVLSYSEWSGEVMQEQSGGKINYVGTAPPSANPAYQPLDKNLCRESLGLDKDLNIIGTVMRNQRRKLYPDLFEAFAIFLNTQTDRNKFKLYCHTSYPDLGWDIPELLQQHGLSTSVYFTYICEDTKKIFASLFAGAVCESPFTGKCNATMCNVREGATYEQLATVMNCFDVYVQYANSEGFGLPQVEAAACGIPVMSVDYSAMSSVVRNLGGIALRPKTTYKELETGCFRAVPDNRDTAQVFYGFFANEQEYRDKLSKNALDGFKKYYQWDLTGERLATVFDSFEIEPVEKTWESPPRLNRPEPLPEKLPNNITHKDVARWLITRVLGEPERLNTQFESRLTRDLLYLSRSATTSRVYENESSAAFDGKVVRMPFNLQIAYKEMIKMSEKRNYWEQKRIAMRDNV